MILGAAKYLPEGWTLRRTGPGEYDYEQVPPPGESPPKSAAPKTSSSGVTPFLIAAAVALAIFVWK